MTSNLLLLRCFLLSTLTVLEMVLLVKNSFSANSKMRRNPGRSRYSMRMSVKNLRASSSRSVMVSASEEFFMAESQNSGIPLTSAADLSSSASSASSSSSSSSSSSLPASTSCSVGSVEPLMILARFS
ncbi:hypothetical protein KCU62_g98, partial [Aureobasidium sp. EXF-3399]